MQATVEQLARLVDGTVDGDGNLRVAAARPLDLAGECDISFVEAGKQAAKLSASKAAAFIAPKSLEITGKTLIRVVDPLMAFVTVYQFLNAFPAEAAASIDPRAAVHPAAVVGEGARIGPFATIGEGTVVGAHCYIAPGAVVGRYCRLGDDVTIHANAVLYDRTVFGDRVTIHAGAIIGADGFGYRQRAGRHVKVPQLGHVEIGDDVEIGANATIDRSTFDVTRIGAGTKIDNLVQIGHNCRIGQHNIFVGQSGVAGGLSTGDYVVLAGQAGVVDQITIGTGAIIGAQAGVTKDVAAGARMFGSPAVPFAEFARRSWMLKHLPAWIKDLERLRTPQG